MTGCLDDEVIGEEDRLDEMEGNLVTGTSAVYIHPVLVLRHSTSRHDLNHGLRLSGVA